MKRATWRGSIALVSVAVATGLTEASFALGAGLLFEWYVAAVACVAWWCGRRPALLVAALSCAAIDFVFLPYHRFSFGMELADAARLVVFVGLALLVAHLVSARSAAERERAERERLLASVAHELGNMIFAVRTWTGALQGKTLRQDQLDRVARGLTRAADALAKLAGDLLDWSRIVLGKLHLEPETFDLADVARDAVDEMEPRAMEAGVTLSASLSPARVRADRDRIHQVALNLLMNSLNATGAGGEVLVSVRAADRRALLSVCDDGRGIAPERLPGLFEGGTVGPGGRGLGFGLALSRDLVRVQGGDIRVHSRGAGKGATFSVELPAPLGPG